MQPLALSFMHRFSGVAGPCHGANDLGTEPQDVGGRRTGQRHRQQSARDPGVVGGWGVAACKRVGVEDAAQALFRQPVDEHGDLLGCGRGTDGLKAAAGVHRGAARADEPEQDVRTLQQRARHAPGRIAHHLDELGFETVQRIARRARLELELRGELQRDSPANHLARCARCEADVASGAMVAGDEPPQRLGQHERHAHRRADAHVAQVFEVYGGYAAEGGEREIKRGAGIAALLGDEQNLAVARVGDQAQPVEQVELASLARDVGARKAVSEIRIDALGPRLLEYVAVTVVIEPIEHDSIESGKRTDRIDSDPVELTDGVRALQPGQRPAQREVAGLGGDSRALELQDRDALIAMRSSVEGAPIHDDVERLSHDRARARQASAQRIDRRAEQDVDRLGQHRLRRYAEDVLRIGADLQDFVALRVEREQHAMRLDRAGRMDGFNVALGQIRRAHGPARVASSHCVRVSNVATAAEIALRVSMESTRSTRSQNTVHIARVASP